MIEQLPDLRTELPVDDAVQDAEFDRGFAHFGRIFRQQAVERGPSRVGSARRSSRGRIPLFDRIQRFTVNLRNEEARPSLGFCQLPMKAQSTEF